MGRQAFRQRLRLFLRVVGGAALVTTTAYLLLRVIPAWIADDSLTGKAAADERSSIRTATLAFAAGVLPSIGAYYTHRTVELNRAGHELDRAGQITERFTRAVEQLGNNGSLEVRLGGIYALERIARDSDEDHGQVVEVLCACVRENTRTASVHAERRCERIRCRRR